MSEFNDPFCSSAISQNSVDLCLPQNHLLMILLEKGEISWIMQPKHFQELEFAFMFLYIHYTS